MKLQKLAQKLDCRLEGDPSVEITGVAGIDHARNPDRAHHLFEVREARKKSRALWTCWSASAGVETPWPSPG